MNAFANGLLRSSNFSSPVKTNQVEGDSRFMKSRCQQHNNPSPIIVSLCNISYVSLVMILRSSSRNSYLSPLMKQLELLTLASLQHDLAFYEQLGDFLRDCFRKMPDWDSRGLNLALICLNSAADRCSKFSVRRSDPRLLRICISQLLGH